MGHWRTVHLFSDKRFREYTLPALRDPAYDLKPAYLAFMRGHVVGGVDHLPPDELDARVEQAVREVRIHANEFDAGFQNHAGYAGACAAKGKDVLTDWLGANGWYYDFGKFFEYFVFQTCTDFYPHVPLGGGGMNSRFAMGLRRLYRTAPVAEELLDTLDRWSLLCVEGGVMGWISAEDVELLLLDKDRLAGENPEFMEPFGVLLEAARDHGLGLMEGIDMQEGRLEQVPQFKFTLERYWDDKRGEGVLFSR